jgi:hypothetical protein
MTDRIPELRIMDITIDSTCDTFRVKPAAGAWGVATVTQSSALPVNPGDPDTWTSILVLATGAAAYGAVDAEEAADAAGLTAPTFSYNSSGTNRGKFTFADTVAFKMDDNSEDLLPLFGFTQTSYGSALSHTSDYPSPYIFTPGHGLLDSEVFPWEKGWDWDYSEASVIEAVTDPGAVCTESSPSVWHSRAITFTLLTADDIWWLRDFWEIARTGRKLKFLQDRSVATVWSKSNPYGFVYCCLDAASKKAFQPSRTFPGRSGLYNVSFNLREWVDP